MNEQTFYYKGYTALAKYSSEDQCYTGKVIGIQHMILYRFPLPMRSFAQKKHWIVREWIDIV